jgi:glycolate oxidase
VSAFDWNDLRAKLKSPESLITNLDDQNDYFHDASLFSAQPSAILKAASTEDIVAAVLFCREHGISITPRGAGTGLSGGCVPTPNALILSTTGLRQLHIDRPERIAVCGPGVITKDLEEAASAQGLAYPPDPASWLESTIGGNVAEGAGGLRCRRFGVTKDYVLGIKAVLADGSILHTGVFNSESGFSLGDVLIASEGTLAIITEIALRLTDPIVPGATMLVAFNRPIDAAQTVSDITAAGIISTVLEFLDGNAAACSNAYEQNEGLDNAAAILLLEASDNSQAETIHVICGKNHSSFLRCEADPEKAEALWKVRRNLSKAVKQAAVFRISEDVAVPISKFPALVDWVAQENKRRAPIRLNSFGHAGDGNLHVNFLAPDDSPESAALVENGIEALMRKTIELSGTITGEHGIGLAKKKYLSWEFDIPTLQFMRAVKSVFDPDRLLNPDKLL